uniref:adenylate isopentenyltransferase 3, chloroplastic n=1 Tax=Erigeron canadensis TaxID=72917 RepID=UPI001CB93F2E|nr:adenylate isopentenyltransferase 3, chloroplastic [Erigeron canadensis]
MRITMMMTQQAQPSLLQIPTGGMNFPMIRCHPQKEKVVVVMGATGTGKSRLSIDLATRYPAEIINSDKIQVYEGLDIATNKISEEECDGVPHHLLGIVDPEADFTAGNFASTASLTMKSIVGRGKLPIIAGGSNSFIEALIDDQNYEFRSRYDVCFLWVDVAMPVLHRFVSDRVNRMIRDGMVEEVRKMYNPNSDYSKGIRRAIGVPEFDAYFRAEYSSSSNRQNRGKLLEQAINETKINTCKLACRQLEKIHRLRNVKGWKIHRLDATPVFENHGDEADKLWAEAVAGPGSVIVNQFLFNFGHSRSFVAATNSGTFKRGVAMAATAI